MAWAIDAARRAGRQITEGPAKMDPFLSPFHSQSELVVSRILDLDELPGVRAVGPAKTTRHRCALGVRAGGGRGSVDGYEALEDLWDSAWASPHGNRDVRNCAERGLEGREATRAAGSRWLGETGSFVSELRLSLRRWLGGSTDAAAEDGEEGEGGEQPEEELYRRLLTEWSEDSKSNLETLPGFHTDGLSSRGNSGMTDFTFLRPLRSRTASQSLPRALSGIVAGEPRVVLEDWSLSPSPRSLDPIPQGIGAAWEPRKVSGGLCAGLDVLGKARVGVEAVGFVGEALTTGDAVPGTACRRVGGRGDGGGCCAAQEVGKLGSACAERAGRRNREASRSACDYDSMKRIWDEAWHGGLPTERQGAPAGGFDLLRGWLTTGRFASRRSV